MTSSDMWSAIVGVALILELTRRVAGLALPIVAFVFILYSFVGPWLPGILHHRGYEAAQFFSYIYSMEGIYGITTAVSARRLRMDTGSGSTRASLLSSTTDVDIDTGSGSVTLVLPANFGAHVDVSTGSGGIDSDFEVRDGRMRRNELRGTIGDGRATVTIETGSGAVRLRRGTATDPRER